ncbi:MAG TPA: TRAP transporter large permease [Spirochaetales bacterium]|nr:TRAP transporter large permease [Spirochaetales bacterium]
MTASTVFITMFTLLLVLIILRVPVSFALAFAVIPILVLTPEVTPIMLLQRMMIQYGSFIMIAIPMFVLAANIMNTSGITNMLLRLARAMVGHLPGGLGHVNVVTSMIFAGISGSSNADAAGEGSIIIPAMIKEGYDTNFTVAVTACSAVMGVIIPPSIIMVVWGGVMNVSVSGLFLAGIVPGLLIGFFQMGLVHYFATKRHYPRTSKFSMKELGLAIKESILAVFTPIIIVGGIVFGIVTPTEASVVAVFYAAILGFFVYKTLNVSSFLNVLKETLELSTIVLFCVGTAAIYAWVMAYYKIPQFLVYFMGSITTNPTLMLMLIVIVFLIVGMFIDAVPAIIIFAPLLRPVAESVGIHPMHFAIVGCIALAYGLITPPYGLCLLIACDIAKINCITPLKEVGAFLGAMLIVLLIIIFFPVVTLGLPQLLMPSAF